MTRHLIDVASYQGALKPSALRSAGFTAVNLKVSHGLTQRSVHPDVAGWAGSAKALGLGVSTFHYLDGSAAGDAQAEYAYSRIAALGLVYGTAHQVDTEADAPWSVIAAYAERMQALLARPIVLYTGDWWWTAKGRGWNGAAAVPYLWSAPNAGYLGRYPGDTSAHWTAGYGGWATLAVMQYAVAPLAGVDVSMSAIRDESVWTALTQGRSGMSYPPQELKDARLFWLQTVPTLDPLAVGIVGDDSHAASGTSYHLGKDALKADSYSIVESSRDRKGLTNAAAALDVGYFEIKVGGKTYTLRDYNRWLIAQCEAGTADTLDIREVIYSTDGKTVKRWDRLKVRTTGDSSHTGHTHHSYFRDSETRDKTALFRRWFIEIGHLEDPDMLDDKDKQWFRENFWAVRVTDDPAVGRTMGKSINNTLNEILAMRSDVAQLVAAAGLEAAETPAVIAEAVAQRLGAGGMGVQEKAALLRGVLGADAAAVAQAILAG